MSAQAILWMALLPLLGAFFNGLVLRSPSARRAGVVASFFSIAAFLLALLLWREIEHRGGSIAYSLPWFRIGEFQVGWDFALDRLSAVMCLVVTGIGFLIHLYSIGYMAEDKTPSRYFAYLNLFLAAMLILVTAANLVVLFVGWEGVGLSSYLLIGYWYSEDDKAKAGMKAFLVNRIGDAGFLLGIFLCYELFQSVTFSEMARTMARADVFSLVDLPRLNIAALLLFIGAMGKSAQIPLYVWLPDAMAGPTPVSALIHAATMVTAGIYLVARMSFLFEVSAQASAFIATMGAATALVAALIATSQRDIKKVLAYSTVSQLGLMFIALGAGAYVAALFHLVTHAFFKALLFLGAGSVIHALSGEQDIFRMGGLRRSLPVTYWTFAIATLAICGIPPLSGFFSKDFILYSVLGGSRGWVLWALGSVTSLLTAFYMTRLLLLVFFGDYRGDKHPHESPAVMTIPLLCLAVGSVLAGILELPHGMGTWSGLLGHYLAPLWGEVEFKDKPLSELAAMGIATTGAVLAMGAAALLYLVPERAARFGRLIWPLKLIFENKFWVDEFYDLVIVRPFQRVSAFFARFFDGRVIDAAWLLPARACKAGGTLLSLFQLGSAQAYLLVMLLGTLAVLWFSLQGLVFP